MAKKRGNPLSGKFRDPPQEGNASVPAQADQEQDTDQVKLTDAPIPEQASQGDAPAGPAEAPAEPGDADTPALERADQGGTPAGPAEAPAEPGGADEPAPEQADQGDAPAEPAEAPAEPVAADAPAPEQADQGDAPAEPAEAPAEPGDADAPAPEQADQGDAPTEPTEPTEALAEPGGADEPAPEQADQGDAPTEPAEAPAEPGDADTPAPEQADQGDAPAPEQADQGDAPAEPAEAPVEPGGADEPAPQHPEARFVKLADIKPLSGTFVKDVPREDYTELLDNIKAHGLEKPIILRQDEAGGFQLVDGFHRCEAMKQAGMLEILAEVYDMSPLAANRYRKEHHADPDIPIPGKLLPAHPPKEEPAADKDIPAQDDEEFEIPKNFSLPITREGQSELVTTLKVSDIHPFEGHPFNVMDNKDMWDLRDSVQRHGVMEPVMVINRPAGGYEMVSGHRRLRACQLAGIQTIPAIVRNLDRDEATIAMVDANLKREKISPMEKARAYQMKTEAMRRKVGRRSKAEATTGEKPLSADEALAQQVGESVATVQRYKQLNQLEPELQVMVDKGQIPVNTAADIALLKKDEQKELADAIQKEDKVPTGAQVKEMKKQSKEGTLTTEAIKQSVAPTKREENPPLKVTLVEEDLRPYFPDKRTTAPDVKKAIFEALALRQKLQERQAAAKGEAKPPDKPAAGGGQKAPAPGPEKKPDPPAGGAKKPSGPTAGGRGKKPAAPKPKKTNPAR